MHNTVSSTVDRSGDGSYTDAPRLFRIIRCFDLGIVIPVGFIAPYLLCTKPERANNLILPFLGFFITMAAVMIIDGEAIMNW